MKLHETHRYAAARGGQPPQRAGLPLKLRGIAVTLVGDL